MAEKIVRKEVREATEELLSYWDSMTEEFQAFVLRILASLRGGDRAEDLGFKPYEFLGWTELDLIGNLMIALQDTKDVEEVVDALLGDEEEEEEEED